MLSKGKEQKTERKTIMIKTNDIHIGSNIYEDNYEATYESDVTISKNEAEDLMNKHYRTFPVTKSSYTIDGNRLIIRYAVDCCD